MKIIQVIPGCAESAGPTYYMLNLCRTLTKLSDQVELHLLHCDEFPEKNFIIREYPIHKFPHPSLGASPEMKQGLKAACRTADICHNNSLWMFPNIYPGKAVAGTKCKLVTSPHGTLAPWALGRHKFRKWIVRKLFGQDYTIDRTDMFHATCMKEYHEIRAAGYRQPVAVIPIGIDIPEVIRPRNERRKLIYLGRVHPVKAVDRLLKAWSMVANDFPDWDFQIVGPDCGLEHTLRDMVQQQNIPRVEFISEKNGMEKFQCYAAADLYVLPSFTENFGVTVAEALACGTPVITSSAIPWHDIVKHNCGWVSDNAPEALARQLQQALSLSRENLEQMGQNGKNWMRQDYSWQGVAAKMQDAYRYILGEIEKPEFVIEE